MLYDAEPNYLYPSWLLYNDQTLSSDNWNIIYPPSIIWDPKKIRELLDHRHEITDPWFTLDYIPHRVIEILEEQDDFLLQFNQDSFLYQVNNEYTPSYLIQQALWIVHDEEKIVRSIKKYIPFKIDSIFL